MMWVLLACITMLEWFADYLFVLWAKRNNHWLLVIGTVIYSIGVVLWAFLLKMGELSSMSIAYSGAVLVLAFITGIIVFKEEMTTGKAIALVLVIIAIILIYQE
jgi:multidrug transporter EmrE-like cation transporter